MKHDEATEVKRLHQLSMDLYSVYSMTSPGSPQLTQRVLDELRKLKISRDVDGSFLLRTPAIISNDITRALGDVVNRGMGYLGIQNDHRKVYEDHSDPLKSVFLHATRDVMTDITNPETEPREFDHIVFKVEQEVLDNACNRACGLNATNRQEDGTIDFRGDHRAAGCFRFASHVMAVAGPTPPLNMAKTTVPLDIDLTEPAPAPAPRRTVGPQQG